MPEIWATAKSSRADKGDFSFDPVAETSYPDTEAGADGRAIRC